MNIAKWASLMALPTLFGLASCGSNSGTSSVTGWAYNDTKNGGFEVREYAGQVTGPGLVLVEGGTFVMGNTETDVLYDYHSVPRRVTVSSYYMDETEIANAHYREYLYWLFRVFGTDFPQVVTRATRIHWYGAMNWHTMNRM